MVAGAAPPAICAELMMIPLMIILKKNNGCRTSKSKKKPVIRVCVDTMCGCMARCYGSVPMAFCITCS